jgi:hypothetical protein
VSLSDGRRQALLEVKLRALIHGQWPGAADPAAPVAAFPGGAALLGEPSVAPGPTAWVLAGEPSVRSLGGALAWARRRGAGAVHLLVDTDEDTAGVLARRAGEFAVPITVWRVAGRDLSRTEPTPLPNPPLLPAGAAAWADVLWAHGADPVVEHGLLTGEILGLEVARIVVAAGGAHLEVGVGSQDRRAQLLLRPDRDPVAALDDAVAAVREWRSAAAAPHPAGALASERWLRAVLVIRPDLVGAAHLAPVPPPLPRGDLRLPSPAPAAGVDLDDQPLLVVCSTGIDLDLVPTAADARLADGRDGVRLVLAVPPGDDHPVNRDMAAALRRPAELVTVPAGWKAFAPVA